MILILSNPSDVKSIFSGLISLCTVSFSCIYCNAEKICFIIYAASNSENLRVSSNSMRDPPFNNSISMKKYLLFSRAVLYLTMLA